VEILSGFLFGLAAAIPIGPIGILAVTQRVRFGFRRGFSGALTASALDVVYGLLAVEAASFINRIILRYSDALKLIGALVLAAVSVSLFRQSRRFDPRVLEGERFKTEYHPVPATVLLYVTAPTVAAFWLASAGMAVAHGWVVKGTLSTVLFAFAAGAGSAAWYFILLRLLLRSADRIDPGIFRKAFFALGAVLAVFALLDVLSVWMKFPLKL
jgi:threonine/homoserine/homoserine lactone efflux protein